MTTEIKGTLIEGGASEFGWSRIGTFLRCPTLYYARYVRGIKTTTHPLARGIIAHAGLAQHFAKIGCEQSGRDPATFADPYVGMGAAAQTIPEDLRIPALDAAITAYETHRREWPAETMRVRAVEFQLKTEFEGYPYTARADLIMEDRRSMIWGVDHKIVAKIEDKAFTRYSMSGQFHGLHWLMRAKYGDRFGGILLNVIGIRDQRCVRRELQPAPYALSRFPGIIVTAERQIAALMEIGDPAAWPMALHEQVCTSAYGNCDMFERCRWGE